jgi:hypothetical protein
MEKMKAKRDAPIQEFKPKVEEAPKEKPLSEMSLAEQI